MALKKKSQLVTTEKTNQSDRSLSEMYLKVPENGTVKIVPLVDFSDVESYGVYQFNGNPFWQLPALLDNPIDPVAKMGLPYRWRHIMPVIQLMDDGTISDVLFYTFPKTVFEQLKQVNLAVIERSLETEKEMSLKGTIIKVVREDPPKGFTNYTLVWSGDFFGQTKATKGLDLPENTLNLDLGVAGAVYATTEEEIVIKMIEVLKQHADYRLPDSKYDKGTHLGTTIGERLQAIGLMNDTHISIDDEWENLDS